MVHVHDASRWVPPAGNDVEGGNTRTAQPTVIPAAPPAPAVPVIPAGPPTPPSQSIVTVMATSSVAVVQALEDLKRKPPAKLSGPLEPLRFGRRAH